MYFGREINEYSGPINVRCEARGMFQAVLAEVSGVPLRTLQQYEQRQKDIRKANVGYVHQLARALCCRIEDILEYGAIKS